MGNCELYETCEMRRYILGTSRHEITCENEYEAVDCPHLKAQTKIRQLEQQVMGKVTKIIPEMAKSSFIVDYNPPEKPKA